MAHTDGVRTALHHTASVAALTVLLSILAGCTPSAKNSTMTPEESRKALVQLHEATIGALGTTGWTEMGGMPIQECVLGDGSTGVNFGSYQLGPASSHPDADIATIEAVWKSKGLATTVKRSTNPLDTTTRLMGSGGPVTILEFDADTHRTSLTGDSVCVVGNAADLRNQVDGNG